MNPGGRRSLMDSLKEAILPGAAVRKTPERARERVHGEANR
jgi:hypothetical protein